MSGRRRSPRRPSPERQRRKYSESRDDTRSSRRTSSPRREHRSRRSPTPPARSRTDPVISKPVAAQSTDQPPKVAHQKSEPLSLEELIAKRAAQDEMKKPVFLSKEERAKLALEKRQKEVERLRESRPSFSSLYQQKSSDASFNGKSSADDGSHLDQREITQIKVWIYGLRKRFIRLHAYRSLVICAWKNRRSLVVKMNGGLFLIGKTVMIPRRTRIHCIINAITIKCLVVDILLESIPKSK